MASVPGALLAFLGPNTQFGGSNFGRITQVGGFPRLLQWMARVQF